MPEQDIQAVFLSLKVAGIAAIISLPFGILTAYILNYKNFFGKSIVDGMVNLPLVLPPVVVGYLLLVFFGDNFYAGQLLQKLGIQIIFSLNGAVLAASIMGFPLLVRSIRLGMEQIDEKMIHAARTLGAGRLDVIFSVIIPLTKRSIFVGMTLLFARSLGEFGATSIIAGNIPGVTRTVPLAIFDYTNVPGGESKAMALCIVSIALSMGALLLNDVISNNKNSRQARE